MKYLCKYTCLLLCLLCFAQNQSNAQELNCQVTVNAQQIQSSDKRIFETLQKALTEFMNTRQWTSLNFNPSEKIDCSILLIVNERSGNTIKGTLTIQTRRPVFNTSYYSPLLNFIDKDITFNYAEYDPLDFADNNIGSNLTAIMAFYAYSILGLTFDSFSADGGTFYFNKCQDIVNNAQNLGEGWKVAKNQQNRYFFCESYINSAYDEMRQINYAYHRLALDQMFEYPDESKKLILGYLKRIADLKKMKSGLLSIQVFFDAKSDELVNIFTIATNEEKKEFLDLMLQADPANLQKYQKINTNQ